MLRNLPIRAQLLALALAGALLTRQGRPVRHSVQPESAKDDK